MVGLRYQQIPLPEGTDLMDHDLIQIDSNLDMKDLRPVVDEFLLALQRMEICEIFFGMASYNGYNLWLVTHPDIN